MMIESELLHRIRMLGIENLFTPNIDFSDTVTLKRQIEAVLKVYSQLNMDGLDSRKRSDRKGWDEHQALRAALLEPKSVEAIAELCWWIRHNLSERLNINYKHDSYHLKHIAEREVGYVSNGQMIVAMLLCGYKMGNTIVGLNPSFNVAERSIQEAALMAKSGSIPQRKNREK